MEADKVRKIIEDKTKEGKQIILLYHSFGGYIAYQYLFKYGYEGIVGLMEFGAPPITCYPILEGYFGHSCWRTFDEVAKDLQNYYQQLNTLIAKVNSLSERPDFAPFPTPELALTFYCYLKSPSFIDMFEKNRKIELFKLIAYGGKDFIFTTDLMNEKSIYYSYIFKPQENFEKYSNKFK